MAITATGKPDQAKEPKNGSNSATWVVVTQALGPSCGYYQEMDGKWMNQDTDEFLQWTLLLSVMTSLALPQSLSLQTGSCTNIEVLIHTF